MTPSRGPRYSITPADAYDDVRLGDLHIRVLGLLGTYTDNNGWCEVNQKKLAERCRRARETINRAIRDLVEFGYLRKTERWTAANGRTISEYQIIMDRQGRNPSPVTVGSQPPVTLETQPPVTQLDHNGSDAAASQLNDPFFNDLSPQPPLAGGRSFADLWEIWSEDHRGQRGNAEGAFARLSADDQASALNGAALCLKALRLRKARIPALAAYLRNRVFLEFDGAPDVDIDGSFVVKPGTPEWNVWLGEIRKRYGQGSVDKTVRLGYFLPKTRWPEGHLVTTPGHKPERPPPVRRVLQS